MTTSEAVPLVKATTPTPTDSGHDGDVEGHAMLSPIDAGAQDGDDDDEVTTWMKRISCEGVQAGCKGSMHGFILNIGPAYRI